MMKFWNKITILKSLNCDDQLIVTQENIYVVLQFCIFKFATSFKGNDQLSWLIFNNIPERGKSFLNLVLSFQAFNYKVYFAGIISTDINSKTLESLLLENGGIKNQDCFHTYKHTCSKLQKCLDGCIDNPLLLLNLFLLTTDNEDFRFKLKQPHSVNHLAKVLQSSLIVDSEYPSNQKDIPDVLNEAKTYLDIMNDIFPKPILETKIEVSNQIYLNLRLEFSQWLKNQILIVDRISEEIKPSGLDSFIQKTKAVDTISTVDGNELLCNHLFDLVGRMLGTRTKSILWQLFGGQIHSEAMQCIHSVLNLTNALYLIHLFSMFTLEDRIKHIYGKSSY